MAALTVFIVGYAIYTRTPHDFLRYPAVFGLPIAFGIYVLIVIEALRGRYPKKTLTGINLAVAGPLVMAMFVGVFYYSYAVALKDSYLWLESRTWSPPLRGAVAGAITVILGILLFRFRLRRRFLYGTSEAVVGIGVAVHRVYTDTGSPATWDTGIYIAILTAGVYLVVRGFDNMKTGLEDESDQSALTRLMRPYLARPKKPLAPGSVKVTFGIADLFLGILPFDRRGHPKLDNTQPPDSAPPTPNTR